MESYYRSQAQKRLPKVGSSTRSGANSKSVDPQAGARGSQNPELAQDPFSERPPLVRRSGALQSKEVWSSMLSRAHRATQEGGAPALPSRVHVEGGSTARF